MKYSPWTSHKFVLVSKILLLICFYISANDIRAFSPVDVSYFSTKSVNNKPSSSIPFYPFSDGTQTASIVLDDCGAFAENWVSNYGGTNTEVARSIFEAADGGYYIAGHTLSDDVEVTDNNGGVDFWLVKTDAAGQLLWDKNYGGSSTETGKCIQPTPDGGVIFVGDAFSNDGDVGGTAGSLDCWVIKLDAAGTIQWKRLYGGSKADNPEWIEPTPDGGYIIAGITSSSDGDISQNRGVFDYWLLKIDEAGVTQWSKTYGGNLEDAATFVQNTSDGGFVVVGNTYSTNGDIPSTNGDLDATFFKLDAAGNLQFARNFGGSGMDFAECVRQTLDGGYILTGTTASINGDFQGNHGSNDAFVIKLDASGNKQWTKLLGGGAEDSGRVILCNPDGTYSLACQSQSISEQVSSNNGLWDVWFVKLDANGEILAENAFGGSMTDEVRDMRFTSNGGIIVCGFTESSDLVFEGSKGQGDFWAAQFAPPPVAPPVANLGDNQILCPGSMVMLDATDPDCVNCTYAWADDPNITSSVRTINPIAVLPYTVTITNSLGCTSEDTAVVGVSNLGINVTNFQNPEGCGLDNGFIEAVAFGGTGSYNYSWDIPSPTDLSEGTYTLTVDDGECVITETFNLVYNNNGLPSLVDLGEDQAICASNSLTLNAGNNGSTYVWNNNPAINGQTLQATTPGLYTVEVTNPAGCTTTDTITISYFPDITLDLGQDISSCNEALTINSGTTDLTYAWSNGASTPSIEVTTSNEYQLTITDANGCTASDAVQAEIVDLPEFDFGQDITSCVPIELNPNLSNVSYNWSTGVNSSTIEVNASNIYSLTVTDNTTACSFTDTVEVEIVESLEIEFEPNPSGCGSVNIDVNLPGLAYDWSTGENTQTIDVTTSGWYTATVADSQGCGDTDSVFVSVFPSLEIDLGENQTSCIPLDIGFNLVDATYTWSTMETDATITATDSDTYTVTVTDSNGCSDTDSVEVNIFDNLEIDLGADIQSCVAVTLDAAVENLSTYTWTNLNTGEIVGANQTLNVSNSAQYALSIMDESGCSATDTIGVSVSNDLSFDLGSDMTGCEEILIETGNPDYEHEWSIGEDTSSSIMVTTTGTVAVTITDDNGCSASDSLYVTISQDLSLSTQATDVSCANAENGSIQLTPNGGAGIYTYNWDGINENTATLNDLSGGTYTVTLTDEGGCTATESITINEPAALTASIEASNIINCAMPQAILSTPNLMGGSGEYSYTWNIPNAENAPSIEVTEAGLYEVIISDGNDCSITESINITAANPLVLEVGTVQNNLCANDEVGSISVNILEGNEGYTFNWSNLTTGENFASQEGSIENLASGTYQVVVTDSEACSGTVETTITAPEALDSTIDASNGCGDNGAVLIEVVGGTQPYSYTWNNNETTTAIENLPSGMYSVDVVDANGCSLSASTTITNNEIVVFDVETSLISCNDEADGSIVVTPTNGTAPFNYQWSNGATTAELENLESGAYTLFLTDANDCVIVESITLNNPAPLDVNVQVQTTTTTTTVFVFPTGGTAPYNIVWNNGHTGTILENPDFDSYTVTITDANGCNLIETVSTITSAVDVLDVVHQFDVFPNPSNGAFTVAVEFQEQTDFTIYIRNALGQLVQSQSFDALTIQTPIFIENASSGLYLVELQSAEFSVYRKMVVR